MNWKESSIPVKVRLDLSAASALILTSICNFSYLFFLNMEKLILFHINPQDLFISFLIKMAAREGAGTSIQLIKTMHEVSGETKHHR